MDATTVAAWVGAAGTVVGAVVEVRRQRKTGQVSWRIKWRNPTLDRTSPCWSVVNIGPGSAVDADVWILIQDPSGGPWYKLPLIGPAKVATDGTLYCKYKAPILGPEELVVRWHRTASRWMRWAALRPIDITDGLPVPIRSVRLWNRFRLRRRLARAQQI